MPWTRLHALRGYRDLLVELVDAEVAATINLTPVLVDQLLDYAGGARDDHLDLTEAPADGLDAQQVETIRRDFVVGHPAMREAHPSYQALAVRAAAGTLSTADIRDLQVWSTLAWCGRTALRDHPSLAELQRKARGFTEGDKAVLLTAQRQILEAIPRLLRALGASAVGISCSPYHHPILPLLVDTTHARRSMPTLPPELPRFAWPEDALRQLVCARARIAEVTGREPLGLWPSEGSVSPEVAELAADAGFRWLASDDGVLAQSDVAAKRPGGGPYTVGRITAFFRDHELSDRIGFVYSQRPAGASVHDLLSTAAQRGGDVVIALDGENPWEAFPDAGAAFRDALHAALRDGPIRGVRLDDLALERPIGEITRLHTGSWIGADFRVWFGHPDDRRAWQLLAEARAAATDAPADARERAMPHLLAAEGSDWTWWYGDDFETPFAYRFDGLFRAHLRAAWRALGRVPPLHLDDPIVAPPPVSMTPPVAMIDPVDDGWLAWAAAGRATWSRGGSMARGGDGLLGGLRWGWGAGPTLWLRVDTGACGRGTWRVSTDLASATLHPEDDGTEQAGIQLLRMPRALLVGVRSAPPTQLAVRLHFAPDGGDEVAFPPSGPLSFSTPNQPARQWWSL